MIIIIVVIIIRASTVHTQYSSDGSPRSMGFKSFLNLNFESLYVFIWSHARWFKISPFCITLISRDFFSVFIKDVSGLKVSFFVMLTLKKSIQTWPFLRQEMIAFLLKLELSTQQTHKKFPVKLQWTPKKTHTTSEYFWKKNLRLEACAQKCDCDLVKVLSPLCPATLAAVAHAYVLGGKWVRQVWCFPRQSFPVVNHILSTNEQKEPFVS